MVVLPSNGDKNLEKEVRIMKILVNTIAITIANKIENSNPNFRMLFTC